MLIAHLPTSAQPPATRFRDWLLTDNPALVIIGASLISRGVTYAPWYFGGPRDGTHPAETVLPMGWWAVVWIIAGIVCLAATWWGRLAPAAVGAGVGLHAIWAMSFIADSIIESAPRAWLPAVGYANIALLVMWSVWRGNRDQAPRAEEIARELRE